MMTALKKVLDGCKRHNVKPGIHCGAPAYAKKMIEMGFMFVTVGGDTRFLTMGGQAAVQEMRPDAPAKPAAGRPTPYYQKHPPPPPAPLGHSTLSPHGT